MKESKKKNVREWIHKITRNKGKKSKKINFIEFWEKKVKKVKEKK